jgi:hypothetical protein
VANLPGRRWLRSPKRVGERVSRRRHSELGDEVGKQETILTASQARLADRPTSPPCGPMRALWTSVGGLTGSGSADHSAAWRSCDLGFCVALAMIASLPADPTMTSSPAVPVNRSGADDRCFFPKQVGVVVDPLAPAGPSAASTTATERTVSPSTRILCPHLRSLPVGKRQ